MGVGLTKQWLAALGTTRCIIASFTVADEQSINAASAKRVVTGKNETIGSLLQTDRTWLSWDRARPCERHDAELLRQLQEVARRAKRSQGVPCSEMSSAAAVTERATRLRVSRRARCATTRKCDDEDVLQARLLLLRQNLRECAERGYL